MIEETNPLSLVEANEFVSSENKEVKGYFKKFIKIKPEEAKKLKEEIEGTGLLKVKREDIAKIIDLLPEDASDVNKIFTDVSLDKDEINKILEVVKKYR